ncbi:GNAT family N-acetyltransferase [Terrarubrum flagellatum]|uniref:GNAT family N-acetyltransferase n=1 Tax=Terrirubrum flagellatum TaxID=2895980 RepID=UPI0031453F0C
MSARQRPSHAAPAIKVRLAQPEDREAIIDLIWQLNRYESPISGDRPTDRDTARRCLRDNEDAARNTLGLSIVAVDDNAPEKGIVGYLCLAIESIGSFVREDVRRVAYVRELIVDESCRRAGVGKRLMEEAERFARSRHLKRLMLGVLAGNAKGRAFYEDFGMGAYAIEMVKPLD